MKKTVSSESPVGSPETVPSNCKNWFDLAGEEDEQEDVGMILSDQM